ncbi:hypothetical protein PcaKH16_34990 [Parageobacillus caldoxylosilyticus]|nr:hypothetical protein PcaKH16_34990 [Parageobacillus caldoxylosilyticus]BDG45119.1 hypothetical protein PcaKH35_34640 [Parageobacillus caldoxylosilyticus]
MGSEHMFYFWLSYQAGKGRVLLFCGQNGFGLMVCPHHKSACVWMNAFDE